jgi:hypothetical protein
VLCCIVWLSCYVTWCCVVLHCVAVVLCDVVLCCVALCGACCKLVLMPDTLPSVPPTLSNLPGRSSAGSIMSGRLVAAMTYTPCTAAQPDSSVLVVHILALGIQLPSSSTQYTGLQDHRLLG